MKVKENQLNLILKYYTLTTLILMLALPTLVTGVIYIQRRDAMVMEMNRIAKTMAVTINNATNGMSRFAQVITSSTSWEKELNRYFNESYSDHHTFYLLNGARGEFLPNETFRQYNFNRNLSAIQMSLNNSEVYYESLVDNPKGRKVEQLNFKPGVHLSMPLRSRFTLQDFGQLYFTYSYEELTKEIITENEGELLIYDPIVKQLVGHGELASKPGETMALTDIEAKVEKWRQHHFVSEEMTTTGHNVIYLMPKRILWQRIIGIILGIFLFVMFTAGVILIFIFKQIRRYADQVNDILVTTRKIEQGQVYFRINENNKVAELEQITKAINAMLDGQQESMRQVYHLQLQNNEAVLKALQAQINPHFLYNTLEFIRMSAYVEGADSLAEFVYDFSSLLRNNINDEKEATIYQEVYFIKKYVGLYQARYPEKLSFNIELDDSLNRIILPKFTLQPLIENYLVHGVDFSRQDNQLSLTIHREENNIQIKLTDNGKGMANEKIELLNAEVKQFIKNPYQMHQPQTSIGIGLVAQRLAQTFGKDIKMTYKLNAEGGVTVWLKLPIKEVIEY